MDTFLQLGKVRKKSQFPNYILGPDVPMVVEKDKFTYLLYHLLIVEGNIEYVYFYVGAETIVKCTIENNVRLSYVRLGYNVRLGYVRVHAIFDFLSTNYCISLDYE
jgi:hypothetical protein